MQLGIHALVWVTDWTESSIRYAVDKTAETGYDLIEVVIFDPNDARPDETAKALTVAGIGAVTGMALNPAADISSADPAVAKAGEKFVSDAILATRDMGSKLLGGVTHSAMHRYGQAAAAGTVERVIETYARLAARAEDAGVRLGIEAVNRYESNVVNTVDDAARIVRAVGSPALFAHIDSYHMNIEEHDFADTIARNVDTIGHVHAGESNRGYLGSGSVDFPEYFRALVRASYDGPVVFEAFSPAVLKGGVADVLAAWTTHWADSEDLAIKGLGFMRGHIDAATASMNGRHPLPRREIA